MRFTTLSSAIVTAGLITATAVCTYGGDTAIAGQPVREVCQIMATRMFDAQDYTPSALVRYCFGDESDPRVGLALDYGMTFDVYRATEKYNS